jgi:hypothetical protein
VAKEEEQEEESRADYGISEEELSFDADEVAGDKFLKDIKDDYDSITKNPINAVLSDFKKNYLRNEQIAYEFFHQLNVLLIKYSNELNANFFYDNMDIVKLINNLLDKYQNWAFALRENTYLGKEKMIEVDKIIKDYYIPKKDFDDSIEGLKVQIEDLEKGAKSKK